MNHTDNPIISSVRPARPLGWFPIMTKAKITNKQSDKVEVTEAQAWAIEEGKDYFLMRAKANPDMVERSCGSNKPEEFARRQFVYMHFVIRSGDLTPWDGLFEPLNSMSADDLNTALLKGYVVNGGRGMKKWTAKEGNYTYTIDERADGNFDLTINFLGDRLYLWFPSYKSARDYLRREEDFTGRMNQVKEGAE
ncbi:hypothetical protein [Bacillus nakamurai]|uniref:hypothetical protein n=1 Tax=Bacillus nakamurai TaxID=1793963 RepID=UPI0007C5591A|nr:hypothetical protein [Bacillus nakamurai]